MTSRRQTRLRRARSSEPAPDRSSKGSRVRDAVPPASRRAAKSLAFLRMKCPFGPAFFLTQLGIFVRDRCPAAAERLPAVEIHLGDGTTLDVCHVIDLTRSCVVLAVDDRKVAGFAMRTEVVPYGLIVRLTIRAFAPDGERLGFTATAPNSPTAVQGEPHEQHGTPPASTAV
jgi:hypothetical protein